MKRTLSIILTLVLLLGALPLTVFAADVDTADTGADINVSFRINYYSSDPSSVESVTATWSSYTGADEYVVYFENRSGESKNFFQTGSNVSVKAGQELTYTFGPKWLLHHGQGTNDFKVRVYALTSGGAIIAEGESAVFHTDKTVISDPTITLSDDGIATVTSVPYADTYYLELRTNQYYGAVLESVELDGSDLSYDFSPYMNEGGEYFLLGYAKREAAPPNYRASAYVRSNVITYNFDITDVGTIYVNTQKSYYSSYPSLVESVTATWSSFPGADHYLVYFENRSGETEYFSQTGSNVSVKAGQELTYTFGPKWLLHHGQGTNDFRVHVYALTSGGAIIAEGESAVFHTDKSVISDPTITLSDDGIATVTSVPNADTYYLELRTNQNYGAVLESVELNGSDLSYDFSPYMNEGGEYYLLGYAKRVAYPPNYRASAYVRSNVISFSWAKSDITGFAWDSDYRLTWNAYHNATEYKLWVYKNESGSYLQKGNALTTGNAAHQYNMQSVFSTYGEGTYKVLVRALKDTDIISNDTYSPTVYYGPEKYNLWVGSVQVTSWNRNDILGDSGKAKYDPSSQTLTLNNPTISGDHDSAKIYCTGMDLRIAGSYKMTSAANNSLGVFVSGGKVIFDGDFAFYSVGSNAVYSNKDVVVSGGTLFAKSSNNTGLYAGGKLETGWSNTKVEAQGVSKAIHAGGGFNTELVITTPTNGRFGTNTIYESNGTTVAKHAVLEERCTVTFDKNGGTGTMNPVKVNKGTSYKLPECGFTHPNGNQFKNWKIGSYVYNPGDTVTINSDTTVLAQWKGKYTITYDPNGGTGTMAPETYNEGDKYVIPACRFTPPTNMIFGGWLVDGKPDSVGNYWNVYSDHTLKPQWIPSSGIAERVDITVTAPKAGELPSYDVTVYGSGNVITGNEVPVSGSPGVYTQYKGVLWRDMTTRKNHRSNAAFVDGHEYRVSVDLKSLAGTKFNFEDDSKPMTQIYINGSAAEVQPAATDNTVCTAMYTFSGSSGFTVSGSYTSYLDSYQATKIELLQNGTMKYATASTGNSGSYSIPNVAAGTYTLRVSKKNHVTRDYTITVNGDTTKNVKIHPLGDIDGDGKCNAKDYGMASAHAQKVSFLTGYQLACGDVVKNDGKITAPDAARIGSHAQKVDLMW